MVEDMNKRNWFMMHSYRSVDKIKIVEKYGREYLDPILDYYPQLKGQIYISLKSYGFVLNFFPKYNITISKDKLSTCSDEKIRFIAAHFLMQIELYEKDAIGISINKKMQNKMVSWLTIERGFGYDYLMALQKECTKEICDMGFNFCHLSCGLFFSIPCKCYSENEIKAMSSQIKNPITNNAPLQI